MAELVNPSIDFTPLSQLGTIYKTAQNERTLSDIGKGLADGSLDYRQAAGQIAGTGNIGATYHFLQMAEARDQKAREQAASNNFSSQFSGFFGGGAGAGSATPAPQSNVTPAQATPPLSMDRAPVASSPKVWGDQEAVNAGLYDPPSPTRSAPSMSPASLGAPPAPNNTPGGGIPAMSPSNPSAGMPGPSGQRMPTAPAGGDGSAPAVTTPSRGASGETPQLGGQHIPMLLRAMASPDLPAGQKETAKLMLTEAFKNAKEPEKIQVLRAMQSDPALMATETALRRASKTDVNIDTQGGTAFAKAAGTSIAKRFEDLSKEGDTATTDLAMVGQLRDLRATIGGTGGAAALQGKLAEYGIKVGDNVGPIEAYGAIVDKLTPTQRVPGSGSTSDYEGKQFKASLPNLIKTDAGNAIVENTFAGLAQSKIERAKIAEQALSGELKPGEAIKQLRALPSPYENFKSFAKAGFKADPNNPMSATTPASTPSAPKLSRVETDQSLSNARAAIAANPSIRGTVIKRLQDAGLDPSGL